MLFDEELQLLYWLGRNRFSGQGAVVDAGAFLGASAALLAQGLRDNPTAAEAAKRVYSYDLFQWSEFYRDFVPREAVPASGDTLPWVIANSWGELARYIVPRKGDICAQPWGEEPIEILFVDFTQTWQHHDFVVRNFVANLRPGGILIHQDYSYVVCYWLPLFMNRYAEYFDLISPLVGAASAVWELKRPLPASAIERSVLSDMTVTEMLAIMDRSIEQYSPPHCDLLRIQRARLVLHARGPKAAAALTEPLLRDIANPNTLALAQQFAREIELWDEAAAPYRFVE